MSRLHREEIAKLAQGHCPYPTFCGFDRIDEIQKLRKAGEPYLFLDHAYFVRGHGGNYRMVLNGIHQTKLWDVPNDRRHLFKHLVRPWKQNGDLVIVIPAPKNIQTLYRDDWNSEIARILAPSHREIKVKAKDDGDLGKMLRQAWCLVSHSSVAAVEAAVYGVPVFGPKSSPANQVGADHMDIERPVFPDREQWLNTLTYSQFTKQEIASGKAWGIVKELNGV